MAEETSISKWNTIISIIIGIIGLVTWLTGYSNVPEILFGKNSREKLPEYAIDAATHDDSIKALWNKVEGLQKKDTNKITSHIDTPSKSVYLPKLCDLDGKKYEGPYSAFEHISFQVFDSTCVYYLISGEIGVSNYIKCKIMPIANEKNRYKIVSGNATGEITMSDNSKTLFGNISTKDGIKKFTYYNIKD